MLHIAGVPVQRQPERLRNTNRPARAAGKALLHEARLGQIVCQAGRMTAEFSISTGSHVIDVQPHWSLSPPILPGAAIGGRR